MADLLSELERFEQEMKELGAVSDSSSPPSPSLDAIGPSSSVDASSLISDASASSFSKNNSTVITGTINVPTASASGALATSSVPARSSSVIPPSSPLNSLPPSTPVATMLSAAQHSPWLVSGAATTSTTLCSLPMSNASPASALSQFTYSTPPLSYIPSPPVAATDTPVQAVTSTAAAPYFPVPFHIQQHQQQQPVQYQQQQYLQQYQPQQYQQQPQATVIQAPQYTYPTVFQPPIPLPQQQQAQQLFQRDAQTITPEALESVKAALASGDNDHKAEIKRKAIPRKAAGQSWEDPTLVEWPENDYRLFCGDLGNEVNDEVLTKAFSRFPSFNMARVVRDKRTGKTRGYGFVSFSNPSDLAQAMKEMNGKYVGNRPIKLRKSTWKERTDYDALQKQKFSQKTKKSKTAKKNILHK